MTRALLLRRKVERARAAEAAVEFFYPQGRALANRHIWEPFHQEKAASPGLCLKPVDMIHRSEDVRERRLDPILGDFINHKA